MHDEILNTSQRELLPLMKQFKFNDIDYTEAVEFLIPDPPSDATIKSELARISIASI